MDHMKILEIDDDEGNRWMLKKIKNTAFILWLKEMSL